jgi:predicted TIM-barrel fold metal-dependent hydrolase
MGRSRKDRLGRRELLAGTTAGLIASTLPSVLSGCAQKTIKDRSLPDGEDESIAGVGGDSAAGAGGSGGDDVSVQVDSGSAGSGGGSQHVPDAALEPEPPRCADMGERDRVIDFQATHAILRSNPLGQPLIPDYLGRPRPHLPWLTEPACDCYDAATLGQYMLGDGQTSLAVLGSFPYALPDEPSGPTFVWNNDELLEHVKTIDAQYPGRVLAQAAVMPNDRLDLQLEMMERLAPHVAAWKVYTEWSPTSGGEGFFLHEGGGPAMIAKAIELGVPIIAVRKGKGAWHGASLEHSSPRDIGPAANLFPEAHLVVCDAAFEHGLDFGQTSAPDATRPDEDLGWGRGVGEWPEGPYEEHDVSVIEKYPLARGVNSLIKSLRDAGIGPNGSRLPGMPGPSVFTHVYVTSGAAWPNLISRPEEAMHFWGKLLLHVGEERVLWGSASPEFGTPGVIIEAFRNFEISAELQERYGYPALTPAVKAKILGGNAARMFVETGRYVARCEGSGLGAE